MKKINQVFEFFMLLGKFGFAFLNSCIEMSYTKHFARVKYGEMIADMRGKINGTVHAKNRAGAYMRNKT